MNTDIFGKEERKQMLERIESMELKSSAMMSAITNINETLNVLNDKIDGKVKSVEEPTFGGVTEAVMPSYREIQEKHDEEFKARMDKIHEDGNAKFEIEVNKLKDIEAATIDAVRCGDEQISVLKEIRSGIAETNSLLAAILKKMEGPEPRVPPQYPTQTSPQSDLSWTTSVRGSDGDKPYIPKPTYKDDTDDCDVSQLEPKPL